MWFFSGDGTTPRGRVAEESWAVAPLSAGGTSSADRETQSLDLGMIPVMVREATTGSFRFYVGTSACKGNTCNLVVA